MQTIKSDQFQQQSLTRFPNMLENFQKKNTHCQDQAINTLKNIFPSINIPLFNKNSSVWDVLEKSAQKLPRPGLGDITLTINNMKNVVDTQELKIQKNMIEIEQYQQTILKKQLSAPIAQSKVYQKLSESATDIKRRQHCSYYYQRQGLQQEDIEHYQSFQGSKKDLFFSEPEELDYFQNENQSNHRHNTYEDEEDVKKYLSFDF